MVSDYCHVHHQNIPCPPRPESGHPKPSNHHRIPSSTDRECYRHRAVPRPVTCPPPPAASRLIALRLSVPGAYRGGWGRGRSRGRGRGRGRGAYVGVSAPTAKRPRLEVVSGTAVGYRVGNFGVCFSLVQVLVSKHRVRSSFSSIDCYWRVKLLLHDDDDDDDDDCYSIHSIVCSAFLTACAHISRL